MSANNFNYENKFFSILKNIFVGEKIEGISGFVNLINIKYKYFQNISKKLKEDIDVQILEFPNFKEELYEKLYSFFYKYFSETGSIYFNTTRYNDKIYERVYTNKEDVILFWKTSDLYYIKSDILPKNMKITIEGKIFFFDVSNLKGKKSWEKKEFVFELKTIESNRISFMVTYSENGKITNTEEILKVLKKIKYKIDENQLKKVFNLFKKQTNVDYFINKNARNFLIEQFNLWLYQYEFSDKSDFTNNRIRQLKILQNIAMSIIDLVSQFENELVKIWNKPRFVFNSNYVISLNKIIDKKPELLNTLLNHPNLNNQIQEWIELKLVDQYFSPKKIISKQDKLTGRQVDKNFIFLPIDTKFFKDLENEILSIFENIDDSLDGYLIHSENYQGINTILPKFKEKIQTIYIDPPFNKEQDADYYYSVKFKDSTWITMLENRLVIARNFLTDTGSIFVRCDYNGNMYVRLLMDYVFGKMNFINEIIVNRTKKIFTGVQGYNVGTDSILFYGNNDKFLFVPQHIERKNVEWINAHSPGIRWTPVPKKYLNLYKDTKNSNGKIVSRSRIFFGKEYLPPANRHWTHKQESIDEMTQQKRYRINPDNDMPQYLESTQELLDSNWTEKKISEPNTRCSCCNTPFVHIDSNWTDIPGYSSTWKFQTENSEKLVARLIKTSSKEKDFVMDFFLGSGTTAAVAHKIQRRWIGIEMGDHFYSIVLPRMKKVLAGENSGISKEVNWKGGGFFKYYELEQYEDTLRNVKYYDNEPFFDYSRYPYDQYIFLKDLKLLESTEINYKDNEIKVNLDKIYKNLDIPETISNLGSNIKKINKNIVEFENGEIMDINKLTLKKIKSLIWW